MIIYLVTALTILVLLHFMLRNTEQEDAKDESNIRMPAGFEAQLAGWINKFAKEGCERSRNRILALGIAAIPDLLNALIQRRLRPGLNPPTTIARFEQLIGDFGPSALTVIAQQLRNWEPTHRSAPSLIRIARTLKPRQLSQAFVMNSGNDNLCRGYFRTTSSMGAQIFVVVKFGLNRVMYRLNPNSWCLLKRESGQRYGCD